MKPSDYDPRLEILQNNSVGRLLCGESFSLTAFNELYQYLCQKAAEIRAEHVVSKQIIAAIFSAQRAIENNASHNADARNNIDLASQFAMLLELISRGEDPKDRKPGVPRIV